MNTIAMSDPQGYPSEAQVEAILDACENIRDYLITRILVRTGVRISECLDIKKKDVVFSENQILIKQLKKKSDTYRNSFIDQETCDIIKRYCKRKSLKPDDKLFKLTAHSYNRILKNLSLKNKIGSVGRRKWVNPHSFRHYFIMKGVKAGVDIRKLQLLVGHSNYGTTYSYLAYGGRELKDAYSEIWSKPMED